MRFYLQGLTVGLAYAAPIGMQNLFLINSALTQPRRRALLIALIIASFDLSLLLACFFGMGALMERFPQLQLAVLAVGGAVVLWIGAGLLREKPSMDRSVDTSLPLSKVAVKSFVVTWLNPQALIDGTVLFGSFHVGHSGADSIMLLLGFASASVVWFFGVTLLISRFSSRFNDRVLRVINVVCGSVILVYGLRLLLQFFQRIL